MYQDPDWLYKIDLDDAISIIREQLEEVEDLKKKADQNTINKD
jgi:hypothetical protein